MHLQVGRGATAYDKSTYLDRNLFTKPLLGRKRNTTILESQVEIQIGTNSEPGIQAIKRLEGI